jgi:Zn finger protein HypA/HybF involved in hydrogenase expression
MQDLTYSQQLARILSSGDPETFNRLRTLARAAQVDLHTALAEAVKFVLRRGEKQIACWSCGQKRPDNISDCPACRHAWSPDEPAA